LAIVDEPMEEAVEAVVGCEGGSDVRRKSDVRNNKQ
jgi:hypothetical protein